MPWSRPPTVQGKRPRRGPATKERGGEIRAPAQHGIIGNPRPPWAGWDEPLAGCRTVSWAVLVPAHRRASVRRPDGAANPHRPHGHGDRAPPATRVSRRSPRFGHWLDASPTDGFYVLPAPSPSAWRPWRIPRASGFCCPESETLLLSVTFKGREGGGGVSVSAR